MLHYGFVIPGGDVHTIVELAREAEIAGWDGVFYWDGVDIELTPVTPIYDPWATLAAIAMRTERIRIGAMLTPPSRRRPWKLARETMTVDHLSHGRLILPVGLGALDDGAFTKVNGEATDKKTRAQLLDESLEILTGLWSGRPFRFQGQHYHLDEMTFQPPTVQTPRIPIWVVATWPGTKSMARALRYDGVIPQKANITPEDIRALKAYAKEHRTLTTPFEIIQEGETPGDDLAQACAQVDPFAEAGITWWMESMWNFSMDIERVRRRIKQGPPRR
jgi:alkanesulfonate monooxygenase SsuD/methylene tetrahydromethanopterin reductase-like flavin-dependent oxidoreductase (luciferase family)